MIQKTKSIILLLAGLTATIVVHEFGHFIFCKLFHVFTPVFSIGFGPTVLGYQINTTFFQIALLPFGGYVAIDPISMSKLSYIQKCLINIAGISFNIIFAFLLINILFYTLRKTRILNTIKAIDETSPAALSGLQPGDTIISYNDVLLNSSIIDTSLDTFFKLIQESPNHTLNLKILRNNSHTMIELTPQKGHPMLGPSIGYVGIHFQDVNGPAVSLYTIFTRSITSTIAIIRYIATVLFGLLKKEHRNKLTGPIGIATHFRNPGLHLFIYWLAFVNINVALFNIIPLPFLDGGHIAIDTIELLYGQPLSTELLTVINILSMFMLFLFIMYISIRDIQKIRQ